MTLSPELVLIEHDLHAALSRRIVRQRRRARTARTTAALLAVAAACTAMAAAAGVLPDIQLDPARWSIAARGDVDGGAASYVRATDRSTGQDSTFMVEHDAGMDRYAAFLLHERTVDAAGPRASGTLCTAGQLTEAETIALTALRAGTPADSAVASAFASAPCRGLDYAAEQARLVASGMQPASMLMPGAR
jgi:hypothetical protein